MLFEEGKESQKYKDMIVDSPPDRISERYDGRPVRPATLVFPQFDYGTHVGDNLFQEKFPNGEFQPVYLAMDPSWTNFAILAIQKHLHDDNTTEVRVIDEVYGHRRSAGRVACRVAARSRGGRTSCRRGMSWTLRATRGSVPTRRASFRHGANSPDSTSDPSASPSSKALTGWRAFLVYMRNDKSLGTRLVIERTCRNFLNEFDMYKYDNSKEAAEQRKPEDKWNHGVEGTGLLAV